MLTVFVLFCFVSDLASPLSSDHPSPPGSQVDTLTAPTGQRRALQQISPGVAHLSPGFLPVRHPSPLYISSFSHHSILGNTLYASFTTRKTENLPPAHRTRKRPPPLVHSKARLTKAAAFFKAPPAFPRATGQVLRLRSKPWMPSPSLFPLSSEAVIVPFPQLVN